MKAASVVSEHGDRRVWTLYSGPGQGQTRVYSQAAPISTFLCVSSQCSKCRLPTSYLIGKSIEMCRDAFSVGHNLPSLIHLF